jgi:hypothetical protein
MSHSRIGRRIRHSPLFPLLRPRRCHAYAIGAPKTGTTSIASMLRPNFHAAHEPLDAGTLDAVLATQRGELAGVALQQYLRWRDRELHLEFEASHLIEPFAATQAAVFPDARFIVTIREPRAWIASMIDQQLRTREHFERTGRTGPRAAFFPAFQAFYCGETSDFASTDAPLRERSLFSLAAYCRWWARHNLAVLAAVPRNRLLLLRTEQLSGAGPAIATFLGIDPDLVSPRSEHLNSAARRFDVLERIPELRIRTCIAEHCTEAVARIHAADPACAAGLLPDG